EALRALHNDDVLAGCPAHSFVQRAVDEASHRAVVGDTEPLTLQIVQAFHALLADDVKADLAVGRRDREPLWAAVSEDGGDHWNAAIDADVGVLHLSARLDRARKFAWRQP